MTKAPDVPERVRDLPCSWHQREGIGVGNVCLTRGDGARSPRESRLRCTSELSEDRHIPPQHPELSQKLGRQGQRGQKRA